jgi:hypothetical protein
LSGDPIGFLLIPIIGLPDRQLSLNGRSAGGF